MSPFDLIYEVDLWSRVRRSFEFTQAAAQASLSDYENVHLGLKSDLAINYFALRSLDAQVAVKRRSIEAWQKELELTKSPFSSGINTKLEVQLAQAELATVQSQLGELQQDRSKIEHAIALLEGLSSENFTLAEDPLNLNSPIIPLGLPSDLLERRRPDVAEAERKVEAQIAQIRVAIAAYYPVVHLTGYTGMGSGDTTMSLPIFEGGQNSI